MKILPITFVLCLFCVLPTHAQTTEKQIFYANIANPFTLPFELKAGEKVKLKIDSGTVVPSATPQKFSIYPSKSQKCRLSVTINGKEVWKEEYELRTFSAPLSLVLANAKGNEIDTKTAIPYDLPYLIMIKPDETIKKNLRQEYNLRGDGEGVIYRQNKSFKKFSFVVYNHTSIKFSEIGAKADDKIVLLVKNCPLIIYHFHGSHAHTDASFPPIHITLR